MRFRRLIHQSYSTIACLGLVLSRASSFLQHNRGSSSPCRAISTFTSMVMATTTTDVSDPLTRLGLPAPLILGSASFTRKLILKEMGINYHILVRPIDEKSIGDRDSARPEALVVQLADAKMEHLINEIEAGRCNQDLPSSPTNEWVVLTGDQVVTCNSKILEKPDSVDEAKEFVELYRRHPPSTVGSVVLMHLPSKIKVSGVDTATIYFKDVSNDGLVDELLRMDAPILSCAGGLMVEHELVKKYIERIDGTEDSVMGLSKTLVTELLKELSEKVAAGSL